MEDIITRYAQTSTAHGLPKIASAGSYRSRIFWTVVCIIAMTALCRLIVLHSKEADPWMLIAEAGAIAVLAIAAYVMSMKDKISLEKKALRKDGQI